MERTTTVDGGTDRYGLGLKKTHIVRFPTIDDALAVAVKEPPVDARESRAPDFDGGWYGDDDAARTFDDAMRMARYGDPRGALLLRKRLETMPTIGTAPRPTSRHSATDGIELDVGRYATGDPECLIETVRATRTTQTLKIAVERSVGASTPVETMRTTGASVLAVVERMRLSGIPTEIWVTFTQSREEKLSVQVMVQAAGRPVNVDVLSFWISNPAAFRRIGFAIEEQQPRNVREPCGITSARAYGMPTPCPDDGFDEIAPASASAVEQWVRAVMARRIGDGVPGNGGR